jgi:hypothetical protein
MLGARVWMIFRMHRMELQGKVLAGSDLPPIPRRIPKQKPVESLKVLTTSRHPDELEAMRGVRPLQLFQRAEAQLLQAMSNPMETRANHVWKNAVRAMRLSLFKKSFLC